MDRLILLLLLGAVAYSLRYDLQTLWHSLTSSHKPDEAPSLVVVLLSADGDKLGDKISQNADRNLARKITELVSTAEKKEKQEIMFWVVANIGNAAALGRSGIDERFLRRFAASRQLRSVIAPLGENKGYSKRIIQLLDLHLSLGSTSKIYLGSLHSALIAEYLTNVPQHFRNKIVLLETGDVAQTTRDLIKSKTYEHVQLIKQGEKDTMQVDESEGEKEPEKQVKQVSTYPHSPPPSPHSASPRALPLPLPPFHPTGPFDVPTFDTSHHTRKPCNNYFLSPKGCTRPDCIHSHDQSMLRPEEWALYPRFVKAQVCGGVRKQGWCPWGDECYMGHVCPYTESNCPFQQRCFFTKYGLEHSQK